ncbi:Hypothetical protein HVR_LOCUS1175 [uncultured virus]|nr:Hypothetical protein HVR_LOCUS1175 [uncultured virus]
MDFDKREKAFDQLGDRTIAKIYQFWKLTDVDKKSTIFDIYLLLLHGNLKWPTHRRRYLLTFCREITGGLLSLEESQELQNIKEKFENITDYVTLDLCLMFWQISNEDRYLSYIKGIASDSLSELRIAAQTILTHYQN